MAFRKPGDHPEFFRFPAPEGRSRESSIVLDRTGRFWHDGEPVEHANMARAFAKWIGVHPDDGRYILSNGFDWTYFTVVDVPYFVRGLSDVDGAPHIRLSDDSEEVLELDSLEVGADGAVYCRVKGGRFEAKFTPGAQTKLAPWLVESEGGIVLEVNGRRFSLGVREPHDAPAGSH